MRTKRTKMQHYPVGLSITVRNLFTIMYIGFLLRKRILMVNAKRLYLLL